MKSAHFIGVGGIGMSGLAKIILEQGGRVSGSDMKESSILDDLRTMGATISLGHVKENLGTGVDCVVVSSDIPEHNPEIAAARELNIPIIHRSDLLKILAEKQQVVAVAGTHGKTTTSSLLAHVAVEASTHCSFAVGGILKNTQTNAQNGTGVHFILEADESDGTFLKYPYRYAIVTNVDSDHIVHYGSMDGVKQAFQQFIQKSPNSQSLFICGEDSYLKTFAQYGTLYGFHEGCGLRASNVRYERNGTWMDIEYKGVRYQNVISPLYGQHNVLNALAVFGIALEMGIADSAIRKAFATFLGVNRRLDLKGSDRDILVFDDYGHHPTEVKVTLQALRQKVGGRKITVVFQPHRFSRMQYIINEFGDVFSDADELVVTDIFTANEKPIAGLDSQSIFETIKSGQSIPSRFIGRSELVSSLAKSIQPHEAVIFFGAGDSTKAASELTHALQEMPSKLRVGLVFGGENSEHKISKISAKSVYEQLDRSLYDVKLFEISSSGCWNEVHDLSLNSNHSKNELQRVSPVVVSALQECDLFFPILHGPRGEDGVIQGFFETLGKPYVGTSVVGGAVSMDKAKTKRLCASWGVPVVPFVEVRSEDWMRRPDHILQMIQAQVLFPLIIKPVHLGSSVGIEKVNNKDELVAALNQACRIDRLVLVEEFVQIAHEIECAVLGNEDAVTTPLGEILQAGKVYDYAAKYGTDCFKTSLNPDLPQSLRESAQALAIVSYMATDCRGMARVDMFVDRSGNLMLNEVNPIPGFTPISLYPSLWGKVGKNYSTLLKDLIVLSLEQYWNEKRSLVRQIQLGKQLEKSCAV